MAELTNQLSQIIESVPHIPTDVDHPWVAGGTLVAAAGYYAYRHLRFNATDEAHAVVYPNSDLAEQSLTSDPSSIRKERMLPTKLTTAGGALLLASVIAYPTFEATQQNDNANVVVVVDESFSMAAASDLGSSSVSRLKATELALEGASFKGKIGIVQSGADVQNTDRSRGDTSAKLTAPLSNSWRKTLAKAETVQVDMNGTDLITAINLAASTLPSGKGNKRDGTVIVVSDGTIDQNAADMAVNAKKLHNQHVNVKIIVPGTATGTYQLGKSGAKNPAGANTDVFAAYGDKNVTAAQDVASVKQAVQEDLTSVATERTRKPWQAPGALGALLLAAGLFINDGQRANRKV